ncbi:MAG: hypothetical protein QM489_01670 [Candidatus Izemoplasma sp.]
MSLRHKLRTFLVSLIILKRTSTPNNRTMLSNFKKVTNPLTIIAIFAGITEVMCSIALYYVSDKNEIWIIQFLVWFPLILVLLFFYTLNFNNKVLYAPSDYSNEDNFMMASSLSPQIKSEGILFSNPIKTEND